MAPICVRTYSRKQTSCRPKAVDRLGSRLTHKLKKPKHELKHKSKVKLVDTASKLEPSTLKDENKMWCKTSKVKNKRIPLKSIQPSSSVNSLDSSTPLDDVDVLVSDIRGTDNVRLGPHRGLSNNKFLSDNLIRQESSLSTSLSVSVDTTFDKLLKGVSKPAISKTQCSTKGTILGPDQLTSKRRPSTFDPKAKCSSSQNGIVPDEDTEGALLPVCPQYSLELHTDEELPSGFMSSFNLPYTRKTSNTLSSQQDVARKKVYCGTKKKNIPAEVSEHRFSYKLRPRMRNKCSTSYQQDTDDSSSLNFSNSLMSTSYNKNKNNYNVNKTKEKSLFITENYFLKIVPSKSNKIEMVDKDGIQTTYTSTPLKNSKKNPSKSIISCLSPISFNEENCVDKNSSNKLNSVTDVENNVSYNKKDKYQNVTLPLFALEPNKLLHVQDQEKSSKGGQCLSPESEKQVFRNSVADSYVMSPLNNVNGSPFKGWTSPEKLKASYICNNYQKLSMHNDLQSTASPLNIISENVFKGWTSPEKLKTSDICNNYQNRSQCNDSQGTGYMSKDLFESYESPVNNFNYNFSSPNSSGTNIEEQYHYKNSDDIVRVKSVTIDNAGKDSHSFELTRNKGEQLDRTGVQQSVTSDHLLEHCSITGVNSESNIGVPNSIYNKSDHTQEQNNSNKMPFYSHDSLATCNKEKAVQLISEAVSSPHYATHTSHISSCGNGALSSRKEQKSNENCSNMGVTNCGMQPIPDLENDVLNAIEEEEDSLPLIQFCKGSQFKRRGESASIYTMRVEASKISTMERSTRFSVRRSSIYSTFGHRKSRQSHVVIPGKLLAEPKPESRTFRDLHGISSDVVEEMSLLSKDLELSEVRDEESGLCISHTTAEVALTARDVVLQRCNQDKPVSFSEAFSDKYLNNCRKIGEGVYGEVFMWQNGDKSSVIKIIPIEGEDLVNGERQKKFGEILSEIVITTELSNLRFGKDNQTSCFTEVLHNWCIQDKYPDQLIKLWKQYAEEQQTENDCPDMFSELQLFIVIELANGGKDLEQFQFNNAKQSKSIFLQTAFALAVAESSLEFEHRDLHWGNVLISRTKKKFVKFKLDGEEHDIPSYGVQVTIIDFTLSRMTYDGCCIFNDLSLDPGLFESHGDYQFDIYRGMRAACSDNWNEFVPVTNILWLHYLVDKMTSDPVIGVYYRNEQTKVHQEGLQILKNIQESLLQSPSAVDFVRSLDVKVKM